MSVVSIIGIWVRRLFLVLLVAVSGLTTIGLMSKAPGDQMTPSGLVRNYSTYITMRDGIEVAVDVWLPEELSEQQVPALLRTTRYVRAYEPGLLQRIALGLGLEDVHPILQFFNDSGYAVVIVDARGSGASSGTRIAEVSPDEVADMGEVVDWVINQDWSNGKVGAMGVSYVGTTTEMLTVTGHPAIKAVAPLFSDFDGYTNLVRPGGILAKEFIRIWGLGNQYSDSNDVCQGEGGLNCWLTRLWIKGIKPVDSDKDSAKLRQIIETRENYDINATMAHLEYVDDAVGGWEMRDSFPAGYKEEISQANVPMQIWVSWLDSATVDGAIARFNSFTNPQQVIITPYNHGGGLNADPYQPVDTPPEQGMLSQYQERISFLDDFLKTGQKDELKSSIRYYTLGEGRWKTTEVWPPVGVQKQRWYFGENNQLQKTAPVLETGSDSYKIDFTATTGSANRWLANLSGSRDIHYTDREQQDQKLLVYESAPLGGDMEITGAPVVTLQIESDHDDGAFYVYLEDVAPDGTVTYITEGMLRARHRHFTSDTPLYYTEGPYHSFKREDGQPLIPGEVAELQIGLITTSALIKAGHRMRIAIAGHDASVFERIPEKGSPTIRVHRSATALSFVDLPIYMKEEKVSITK